jgi:pyrroline-5-carboxylate reductase
MKLGFVGTGTLSSAIVTGLKSLPGETTPVVVSPRNEEIAAELAARYPDVRIAADNQAVLDQCDTVMLAVRPQIAREVLKELRFRPDHHVVSLIATISREEIAGLVAPAAHVGKALPMPMIAHLQGATLICPPDPTVAAFFGRLGDVIEVEDQSEFDALSVVTATYASYFKYLDTIHAWVRGQGVPGDKARDYITSIYKALANAPDTAPGEDFMRLSQDYATRGGINEQVLRELTEHGTFETFAEILGRVHQRITRE